MRNTTLIQEQYNPHSDIIYVRIIIEALRWVLTFHNYCGALREDLIFKNDAPSSEGIDKDEIMKSIRADMEALLADLAEE